MPTPGPKPKKIGRTLIAWLENRVKELEEEVKEIPKLKMSISAYERWNGKIEEHKEAVREDTKIFRRKLRKKVLRDQAHQKHELIVLRQKVTYQRDVLEIEKDWEIAPTLLITDKKPDFYHATVGWIIFKQWYQMNGVRELHGRLLAIMSYYECFLLSHVRHWFFKRGSFDRIVGELIDMRYVIQTSIPGKRNRPIRAWVLTARGKEFITAYEVFYDKTFEQFRKKDFKNTDASKLKSPTFSRRRKTIEEKEATLTRRPGLSGLGRENAFFGRYIDKWTDEDED